MHKRSSGQSEQGCCAAHIQSSGGSTLISEGICGTSAVVAAGAEAGAAAGGALAAGAALEGMATVREEGGAEAAALPNPKDSGAGAELTATAGAELAAGRAPAAMQLSPQLLQH